MNQEYKEAIEKKRKPIKILEESNFFSVINYFFENDYKINYAICNKEFIQLNNKLKITINDKLDDSLLNFKIGENSIKFITKELPFIAEFPEIRENLIVLIDNKIIFEGLLDVDVDIRSTKKLEAREHSIEKIFIEKKILQIIKIFEKICNLAVLFFEKDNERKEKENKIKEINSNISLGDLDD